MARPLARTQEHKIVAQPQMVEAATARIELKRVPDAPPLPFADQIAQGHGSPPGFDLDRDQSAPAPRDDVDFACRGALPAGDNLVALEPQ